MWSLWLLVFVSPPHGHLLLTTVTEPAHLTPLPHHHHHHHHHNYHPHHYHYQHGHQHYPHPCQYCLNSSPPAMPTQWKYPFHCGAQLELLGDTVLHSSMHQNTVGRWVPESVSLILKGCGPWQKLPLEHWIVGHLNNLKPDTVQLLRAVTQRSWQTPSPSPICFIPRGT